MNEEDSSMNVNNFTLGGAYLQSMEAASAKKGMKNEVVDEEEARMDTHNQ